jgi:hypothetical protein
MGAFEITSPGNIPGYDVEVVHTLNSTIISDPILTLIPAVGGAPERGSGPHKRLLQGPRSPRRHLVQEPTECHFLSEYFPLLQKARTSRLRSSILLRSG